MSESVEGVTEASVAPGFHQVRVARVVPDTASSVVLTLEPVDSSEAEAWRFAHGQFLLLRRPGLKEEQKPDLRRCYSLCSPAPDGPLRVAIRLVAGGRFSTWAAQLTPGDVLEAMPPRGKFTSELNEVESPSYLLVAAGSGITPIYSVARTILEQEPSALVTLVCINRMTSTTMLLGELEGLRDLYLGRLRLWHSLTREHAQLDLLSGRLTLERLEELRRRGLLPQAPDRMFVCAPPALTMVLKDFAQKSGVPEEALRTESFGGQATAESGSALNVSQSGSLAVEIGSKGVASTEERGLKGTGGVAPTPVATLAVTLHGRTTNVDVREGETLLEATLRVRPEAPFSCRAGVCSTCMARLKEGRVRSPRSDALSAAEEETGLVLACRAKPDSSKVAIDFDI